jgi:DNA-binding transcriptional LysR family regulator
MGSAPSIDRLLPMSTEKLDWNDLRYFLAAVRAGTLAGAARALGVKHSTVGRRLSALERALGAPLVIRTEHGLQLTPVGEGLVPHAETIERSAAQLQNQAASQIAHVRVAVPTGLVRPFTPHLAKLRREHPDISIEFLSSSLPADLHKGEAELALRVGLRPVDDEGLIVRKIGDFGWSLYASPSYLARHAPPADPRDLAGQELLGFHSRLGALPGGKWIAEHGAGATIVMINREIIEMVAAAVTGVGLAALPCIVGDSEPGLMRLTTEVIGQNPVSVVYRREVGATRPVSIVIRFVIDALQAHISGAAL